MWMEIINVFTQRDRLLKIIEALLKEIEELRRENMRLRIEGAQKA